MDSDCFAFGMLSFFFPPTGPCQHYFFEILINRSLLLYNNQSFIVSSQILAQTMASPPCQVGVCIADLLARIPDSSAGPEQSSFEEFQFGNFPLAEESTPGLEPLVKGINAVV